MFRSTPIPEVRARLSATCHCIPKPGQEGSEPAARLENPPIRANLGESGENPTATPHFLSYERKCRTDCKEFDYHLGFFRSEPLMQDINPIVSLIGNLKGRVQSLRGYL